MINGLNNVSSLVDLLGHPVVTYNGNWGVIYGFTFEGTICFFNGKYECYESLDHIHTVFPVIEDTIIAAMVIDTYNNRRRLTKDLANKLIDTVKVSSVFKEILELSKSLEISPENWRKAPIYSLDSNLVSPSDPSVNDITVSIIWQSIPDNLKITFEDQKVMLLDEAVETFIKNNGIDKINYISRGVADEFSFLIGLSDPYDILADLKKEEKKLAENSTRQEIKKELESSSAFASFKK